ncbi:class I SAM-dependent methyltransferase [Egibacter rhizosphaerae]|uniref:Class I SAM-dependent methyltransferase n=1 Tax=Egibacter rhizosphaerae TaxID=1670831 RepID=A0A411YLC7_9ACTN|nr:class I SAM-dependent methyltransferase [Egibacter rhizosphaerae]
MNTDGEDYQRRIAERLADEEDPHGEVRFVERYAPGTVLDAGCGTGRVAIELARRGYQVVGADVSESMLSTARRLEPAIEWVCADLSDLDLARRSDVVVMAGNVPLFTAPGTTAGVVAGCARHLTSGGWLITGFQLDKSYDLATYDAEASAAGLSLVERYATWDLDPFEASSEYAVSVHRAA